MYKKNRNDGINTGDYSYISAGTGNSGCFIYLDEGAIPLGDVKMSLIGINAFNTQVNGSLNVSGKVTFGQESPPVSNSVFSVYNNISVIKKQATPENNNIGDVIHLNAGTTLSSYITISDNSNISINSNGSTRIYGKQLEFFGTDSISFNGKITGYLTTRSPVFFTTNGTITLNSKTYAKYDIDLNLYTRALTLDGIQIRQFRLSSWHASGDFENLNESCTSNRIFMSDFNGLSLYSFTGPLPNTSLDYVAADNFPTFYRNNFNVLTYLACTTFFGNSVKVYCVFEDLL